MEILLRRDTSIVNDEDDASNTPLHLAALEGHSKVVQILLSSGAAVDARFGSYISNFILAPLVLSYLLKDLKFSLS